MASRSAALNIIFGADTNQLDKALGVTQKKLRRLSADMKSMGRNMSVGLTAPIVALGANAVRTFANFESSMSKVKAISGATDQEFKRLESSAKMLGRTTTFTASEVAGLQTAYARLGFSAREIEKVTEATLYLAQASGSDLETAADVAGATLRGFGLDAAETTHITDVMAKSFASSALDMNAFQESMKYVAPVAKKAGIGVEEATAMLAALSSSGIKGSQAGTALRRIISELGATGGDVAGTIKRLAAEGINLADAKDEVGRSAQTALLVLAEQMDVVDELTTSFENADGAAKDMADTMMDNTKGGIAEMNSALEGMNIAIGEALAPLVIALTDKITEMANAFTDLDPGMQKMIIAGAAIVAALGPMLMIAGSLVGAYANLQTVLFNTGSAALVSSGKIAAHTSITTAAGRASALAAGKVRLFSNVMKAVPFAFMLAGLNSLYSKYTRAKQELEDMQQQQMQLAARDRTYEETFANLENLDPKEIVRRIDEMDALSATLAELDTSTPSRFLAAGDDQGFADMADRLIPRSVIEEIKRRTAEIQSEIDGGMVTFGATAEELATNEVIGGLRARAKAAAEQAIEAAADADYQQALQTIKDNLETALQQVEAEGFIGQTEIEKQELLADAFEKAAQEAFKLGETDLAQTYKDQAAAADAYAERLQIIQDLNDDLATSIAQANAQFFVDEDELNRQRALADAYEDAAITAYQLGKVDLAEDYKEQAAQASAVADALQEQKDALADLEGLFNRVGMSAEQAASQGVGALLFALESVDPSGTTTKTEETADAFENMAERIQDALESVIESTAVGFGELIGNAAAGMEGVQTIGQLAGAAIGSVMNTLGQLAIEVGTTAIATGAAVEGIKKALESLNPAAAIAAGIALVALGQFAKNKLSASADVPALASGGITTGETLALIGDNPSGKEAVIPFERMGQFLQMAGAAVGPQQVVVTGRLSGRDIMLSNERSLNARTR